MKASLHYVNGETRQIDIPDELPTPEVYICKDTNSVHVLNVGNGYEYYEKPYFYVDGDKTRHGKAGRDVKFINVSFQIKS